MKTLAVLCLLCATAYGFPASLTDDDSDESVLVNPVGRKGMPSVVEVDVGDSDEDSFFFPSFFRPIFYNPFPKIRFGGFSNLFQNPFFGWNSIFQRPPSDAKITNSTSTTKIVDGHKITVNATTYENEKNGAVFQYEVIEVSRVDDPQQEGDKSAEEASKTDGEETTTKNSETADSKNDNNLLDNEVYREEWNQGNVANNGGYMPAMEINYDNINQFGSDYIDLSDDILVNEIAEQAAKKSGSFSVPPDVEVFAVPEQVRHYSPQRQIHQTDYYSPHDWQSPPQLNNLYNYNYAQDRLSHPPYVYNVEYYDPRLNFYKHERIPEIDTRNHKGMYFYQY